MPTRKASAVWEGTIKAGHGKYSGESGTLGGNYSFVSRFESGAGSNPEELLAAAEAACFSMALSGALERNGTPSTKIETTAHATIEKVEDKFRITTMKLHVRVAAAGLDQAAFLKIAEGTKEGCPISAALKNNVKIELDAALV